MLEVTGAEIALLLLYLALLVLFFVVLLGFHKKNKTEIRVIRKRLGLGENAADKLDKGA
ncbi:hypothetical protein QM007_02385 [Rothia sp. SD9660Na]|uniref:hypothetical protein n=1 Tax=Rothia sp. SD9660Na TaxID=3047030 RepID=UPI0024BA131D|nr:hypothetical protein [Rothia sp. SD9660Na]WHS50841.1 hypothetical protein QM007_02385 [Rothia sp. SD9660Na]